jgi:chromate transporter
MANLLLSLMLVFLPLSFATVGGGQSALADIHRQVVEVHHWMTPAQFLDVFAIARMAPGPGSVLCTLIGWHVAGFWGAVVATLSIIGPTALLAYGVAHIWARFGGARWQRAIESGLRPVATGMILAAVYVLFRALEGGWAPRVVALASAAILFRTRVHPLVLLACGAGIVVMVHANQIA